MSSAYVSKALDRSIVMVRFTGFLFLIVESFCYVVTDILY